MIDPFQARLTTMAERLALVEHRTDALESCLPRIGQLETGVATLDHRVERVAHDLRAIGADSHRTVEALQQLMNFCEDQAKMLGGHTDSVGGDDYNMNLSELRTLEVKNYLLRNGLHPSRILTQWFGPHRPAADNSTPEGRYLNRRVVIELIR